MVVELQPVPSAVVLSAAGVHGAHWGDGPWWLAALAAQLALDLGVSSAREYFGLGHAPNMHVRTSPLLFER